MGTLHGNVLVIRLQPDEGITLRTTIKDPGPGGFRLSDVALDMSFADALGEDASAPDAYERLVMDVIRGDQTLFMRGDEAEASLGLGGSHHQGMGRSRRFAPLGMIKAVQVQKRH